MTWSRDGEGSDFEARGMDFLCRDMEVEWLEEVSMALSPDQTKAVQTALQPLAPILAGDLSGALEERVVNFLSVSILSKASASPQELVSAIADAANTDKIKLTEALWISNRPSNSSTTPEIVPIVPAGTTMQSRIQQTANSNNTAIYLAYITTFGFFLLIFSLIALDRLTNKANVDSPFRDILMTLMGVVGTSWAGIISYYFGSSVGSRQQSETLQDISRGVAGSRVGPPNGTAPTSPH
jgi:hypothetical protein